MIFNNELIESRVQEKRLTQYLAYFSKYSTFAWCKNITLLLVCKIYPLIKNIGLCAHSWWTRGWGRASGRGMDGRGADWLWSANCGMETLGAGGEVGRCNLTSEPAMSRDPILPPPAPAVVQCSFQLVGLIDGSCSTASRRFECLSLIHMPYIVARARQKAHASTQATHA